MARPVRPSRRALRDIDEAWSWYLAEAGAPVAERFLDALEAATGQIGRQPGIGSPRWAHALNLPGLRSWPVSGYPYLLFYFEHDDAVDLVRLLHGSNDIPATLADPEAGDAG